MPIATAVHPEPDRLHAYGRGDLAPDEAAVVEAHLGECLACCRLLEAAPADSFVGRLRKVESGTTADAPAGTLADATEVPAELREHPRYRVVALLGQGGMGAVYRAEHLRMERRVALKVIHPGLLRHPSAVERFEQEVRAAARLHHPNIVTAHDADQAGTLHFLVMEHVEGITLAQQVALGGPLPAHEAADCARQAALGLQHAHEQGMVHRDIKPANLMRTPDGVVKILDFGLARLSRGEPAPGEPGASATGGLTTAGTVMGTADYIAPEQAADPRTADIRADVYSLGSTLYTLLTGEVPYPDGGVREKLLAHERQPLPTPRRVPAGLVAVLRRMTAKRPEDRYATPAEVAAALAPHCQPIRSRRRLPVLVALLALLVGATLLAGVVVKVTGERGEVVVTSDDESLEIVARPGGQVIRVRDTKTGHVWTVDADNYLLQRADDPDGLAIRLEERGTLTVKRKGGGGFTVTTGPKPPAPSGKPIDEGVRLPSATELARRATAADGLQSESLRSLVDPLAEMLVIGGSPGASRELVAVFGDPRWRFLNPDNRPILDAQVSPDDRHLGLLLDAGGKAGRSFWVFDVPSGYPLAYRPAGLADDVPVRAFAFTADGWVLVHEGERVRAIDRVTGALLGTVDLPKAVFPPGEPVALAGRLVGDKRIVYVGHPRRGEVHAFDLAGGEVARDWPVKLKERDGVVRLTATPRGGRLRVATKRGLVEAIDATRGRLLDIHDGRLDDLLFNADGAVLAYRVRGEVTFTDVVAGGPAHFEVGDANGRLLLAPDGRRVHLPATGLGPNGNGWHVTSWALFDDGGVRLVPRFARPALAPGRLLVPTPDGTGIVVDPLGRIEPLPPDGKPREPGRNNDGHLGPVERLGFSPDGRFLVTQGVGRDLAVWDVATGRRVRHIPEPSVWTFTPNGKHLAYVVRADPRQMLYLLDLAANTVKEDEVLAPASTDPDPVAALAYSPDGKLRAKVRGDHKVSVRKDENNEVMGLVWNMEPADQVAFTPGGRYLVTRGTKDGAATVVVWDWGSGEVARTRIESAVGDFAFLPDGRSLAIVRKDGVLAAWDWVAGERRDLGMAEPDTTTAAVVAPGGGRFLGLTPGGLLVRDWGTAKAPDRLLPVTHGTSVAVSPEGRYVAVGRADGTTALFRLAGRPE